MEIAMNIKKISTEALSFPMRLFSDGFTDLKNLNLIDKDRGRGDHDKIYATDYFKNNFINLEILDRMPDGRIRTVKDGIVVNGRPLTLMATMDLKKSVVYAGSAESWDSLLVSMYALCKPNKEGKEIKSIISKIFKRCFNKEIEDSIHMLKLNLKSFKDKSMDLYIESPLLLNSYITSYIKNFIKKINNENVNIEKDIEILKLNYFNPYINSFKGEESVAIEVNNAISELRGILTKLTESVLERPRILQNILSKTFYDDISIIISFMDLNDNNLYSLNDFLKIYNEVSPEKFEYFKNNLIHDDDHNFSENEITLEFRKLFKKELDNLANKNTLITKNKNEMYSIIGFADPVLERLGSLYRYLYDKRILKIALKYIS